MGLAKWITNQMHHNVCFLIRAKDGEDDVKNISGRPNTEFLMCNNKLTNIFSLNHNS